MTADNRPLFDDPDDARAYQALRRDLVWLFYMLSFMGPGPIIYARIDDATARMSALLRGTGDRAEPGMIPRAFLD